MHLKAQFSDGFQVLGASFLGSSFAMKKGIGLYYSLHFQYYVIVSRISEKSLTRGLLVMYL
jgi:hypothetical protein